MKAVYCTWCGGTIRWTLASTHDIHKGQCDGCGRDFASDGETTIISNVGAVPLDSSPLTMFAIYPRGASRDEIAKIDQRLDFTPTVDEDLAARDVTGPRMAFEWIVRDDEAFKVLVQQVLAHDQYVDKSLLWQLLMYTARDSNNQLSDEQKRRLALSLMLLLRPEATTLYADGISFETLKGASSAVVEGRSGGLLIAVRDIREDLIRQLQREPESMFSLTSRQFEYLVADMLHRDGFEVQVTPAASDGGRDVVAQLRTAAGCFVLYVECKRYARANKVGVNIARQLLGVVQSGTANAGLIVTTSTFTQGVHKFRNLRPHLLNLRAYGDLVAWLQQMRLGR